MSKSRSVTRSVDLSGARRASRAVSAAGGTLVSEKDVDDKSRLISVLREHDVRLRSVEGVVGMGATEFEVVLPSNGSKVSISHGYGCPVRFYVVHWTRTDGGLYPILPAQYQQYSHVDRICSLPGTWLMAAAGNTVGCRFRLKTAAPVVGVRFLWTQALAKTVRCRIYNDSTGASLASVDVAVNNPGVYVGYFSTPITADLTGVDIVASIYETSGTSNPYSNDTAFAALLPLECGPFRTLKQPSLFLAGDNKPTTVPVGASYMVEPVQDTSGAPVLVADSTSDSKTLVLNCWGGYGKAVVRVEPSQVGVSI